MESILVSSIVFLVVFGGALAGMRLRLVLPQNQLGPEVKDVIRLVTGLLVTMTALVLGMLVSTANSSYQQRKDQLTEMASDFVGVDRLWEAMGQRPRPPVKSCIRWRRQASSASGQTRDPRTRS